MPFPDELSTDGIRVLPYQPTWSADAATLAKTLRALVPDAIAVEHIGSTSIPGMAAKPCLDMMIVVSDIQTTAAQTGLAGGGFRRRPELWNNLEPAAGWDWPKMVFAPPVGAPSCNVHVRQAGTPPVRVALLFRDFLRANPDKASTWSQLKLAIARTAPDLEAYGQIKAPAWSLLMELAEQWVASSRYEPVIGRAG